nr:YbhB/YbcL family Raf kinase inhibitor-like protein [Bradyrhizobium nanningense]
MRLLSKAFADGSAIPRRFTCDGDNVSPPLEWSDAPQGTRSYVLLCDDPDAPGGGSIGADQENRACDREREKRVTWKGNIHRGMPVLFISGEVRFRNSRRLLKGLYGIAGFGGARPRWASHQRWPNLFKIGTASSRLARQA